MHVPQGRGYVTHLVPARTEGAFNSVPSLQNLLILCGKTVSIGTFGW